MDLFKAINIIKMIFLFLVFYQSRVFSCSPVCAVDSGVDFAMDEDEEYN